MRITTKYIHNQANRNGRFVDRTPLDAMQSRPAFLQLLLPECSAETIHRRAVSCSNSECERLAPVAPHLPTRVAMLQIPMIIQDMAQGAHAKEKDKRNVNPIIYHPLDLFCLLRATAFLIAATFDSGVSVGRTGSESARPSSSSSSSSLSSSLMSRSTSRPV